MSLLLDAAGDQITFGSPANLRIPDPFTFMIWLYQVAIVNGGHILGITRDPSTTDYRFRITDASGNLQVLVNRPTDTIYVTNDTPMSSGRNGLWTFLATSFNGAGAAVEVVNIYLGTLTSAAERTYGT